MDIYSPNSGDIKKFRLNVYKSVSETAPKPIVNDITYTNEKPVIKIEQPERKKKENLLMKAVNSCFDVVKQFFEYEEVV